MALSKDFLKAWTTWYRTPRPVSNFRSGQRSAPSYGLECELDHSATWVAGLAQDMIAGSVRENVFERIEEESADLERLLLQVDSCAVSEETKQDFRGYIAQTRALLAQIRDATLQG